MKKYLVFLVVVFAIFSCEENVSFNNPSFQGMKDNVFWRAVDAKAFLGADGSLIVEGYTGNEILTLRTTSTTIQRYPLGTSNSKTAVYVLNTGAGEVSFTTGIGIGNGEIVITEYDDEANTVSGTFKFNAENTDGNPLVGDVLNFQQGVFYKIPISLQVP
ncbi:DUF6252 family protein [Flavobacterium sandaracinum]|uniref:Uncharacterized protein n=1 Tax=Flavobacterium sandaracinum TaxID=2541733 RepID=A0A4R5CYX9_9FLAO|nr:DUF6252 family protein [Flavobacterium sandaracinum]TDE05876.1 hypothetical protein E0F91_04645 [Flavobacterium sandaracinum]